MNNISITSGTRYLLFGIHEKTAPPQSYADLASMKITVVPEPSVVALMCVGILGLGISRRRDKHT